MCGLAGLIDPKLGSEEGKTLLEGMLASIRHRGPDASATWVDLPVLLGHNRLSIIDLSERGNQPMERDGLVLVHNGEIYNYLEIREELTRKGYRFTSESDTEVILAAYREWGADCVNRFVGMWAFAIWDKAKRELFCSRDRFGIKPFYYIHSGERFYFGSEYKPLKLSPVFDSELNRRQIRRGFQVGAIVYRDETYYECMKALPERSNLLFKNGTVTVSPYWDIDGGRTFSGTFEEKKQRFLELFRDSVRLHLRSDVPIGGMLSGGLDSTSIASMIGTDSPEVPYRTYTIYYDGWNKMDERPWANQVISAFPNLEPVLFTPTEVDLAESYESLVEAHDTPVQSTPAFSCYFLMRAAAKDGLKVMLDGQGADEYLAGYPGAFDRHIAGHLKRLQFLTAARALSDFRRERSADLMRTLRVAVTSVAAVLANERTLYLRHIRPTMSELLRGEVPYSVAPASGSRLNQYCHHSIFGWFLPSLLHYGDRMSMAFSVECRVPFLDHRLVEFVFSLDDDDKIRSGQSKYILRKSMEGILPDDVIHRKGKQGFLGGEADGWLRGPLRHLIERPMEVEDVGPITNRQADDLVREFKNGSRKRVQAVWNLASLNYWLHRQ